MAFAVPAMTAVGGLVGGGALTGTALTLGAAGTLLEMQSRSAEARYRQGVLNNQAELQEQQAAQARVRGQMESRDADRAAALEIGDMIAMQAASGLSLSSRSFRQSRATKRLLARQDSIRIRDDFEREAIELENQASGNRAEGRLGRRGAFMDNVGSALSFGSSVISSATNVRQRKAMQLRSA